MCLWTILGCFVFFLLPFKFSSVLPGFILALGQACCQIGVGSWCKACAHGVDQALIFASVIINAFFHLLESLPLSHWQLNWKPTATLLQWRFAQGASNRLKLTQIMILIGLIFASGFRKKASYFSPSSSLVNFINLSVVLQTWKTLRRDGCWGVRLTLQCWCTRGIGFLVGTNIVTWACRKLPFWGDMALTDCCKEMFFM